MRLNIVSTDSLAGDHVQFQSILLTNAITEWLTPSPSDSPISNFLSSEAAERLSAIGYSTMAELDALTDRELTEVLNQSSVNWDFGYLVRNGVWKGGNGYGCPVANPESSCDQCGGKLNERWPYQTGENTWGECCQVCWENECSKFWWRLSQAADVNDDLTRLHRWLMWAMFASIIAALLGWAIAINGDRHG